jgi:S1-C subfamily serine protease
MVDAISDVSPAAAAGIRPGDVIMTIDAQPVHSAHDIESAIATSQTGTVRVMYFRSGVVQTEVNVKVR